MSEENSRAAGEALAALLAGGEAGQLALIVPDSGEVLTYAQVAARVETLAQRLAGLGVRRGDRVDGGQLLGFLEAMKVEIGFLAPVAGVVQEIRVAKGQLVAAGDVLVVIEPEAGGSADGAGRARLTPHPIGRSQRRATPSRATVRLRPRPTAPHGAPAVGSMTLRHRHRRSRVARRVGRRSGSPRWPPHQ